MKLSDITPNPSNPRIIKDEKFLKLKDSINAFPKMMELRPIIVDETMTVLGGNMRLKALSDLGFKEIPDSWVKKASELSDEEKKQFIIKDNVGFGEWDWQDLQANWDTDKLEEWGLEVPGFEGVDYSDKNIKGGRCWVNVKVVLSGFVIGVKGLVLPVLFGKFAV